MEASDKNYLSLINQSLKISAGALPTLAIIAYFSGWQYVNEFFSSFSINRSSFSFTDYTTFTYSFSVLANIVPLILNFKFQVFYWLVPTVFLFAGPRIVRSITKQTTQNSVLITWSWVCLITALFFLSQQAGALDAQKVKNTQARPVKLILSKSFKNNLISIKGENWANQRMDAINKASNNGALALIWRNSNETILLIFGTSGKFLKKPMEVLRLNNKDITAVFSTP